MSTPASRLATEILEAMEASAKGERTAENGEEMTEQQIVGTYRGMLGDVNQLRRKIAELEQEVSEHQ